MHNLILEFCKARGFPVGTVRTHGGKKVIKTADGRWKPVKSNEKVSKKKVAKKKTSKKKVAKKKVKKYIDVGEKIGGAKKDLAQARKAYYNKNKTEQISFSDAEKLEKEALLQKFLNKERQIGNVQELYDIAIKQGNEEDPYLAYAKLAIIDALPSKPQNTKEARIGFMELARYLPVALDSITDARSLLKTQQELLTKIKETKMFKQVTITRFRREMFGYTFSTVNRILTQSNPTKREISHLVEELVDCTKRENGKIKIAYTDNIPNQEIFQEVKDKIDKYFSGDKKPTPYNKKEKVKKPTWNRNDFPGGQEIQRIGPKAKSKYTAKSLLKTFDLRAVEYGNWVKGEDAKLHTENAGLALNDLSQALEIDPKNISMKNRLGLSFGGRGRGGIRSAMAHYESKKKVINLTKRLGAGSLAHEWFHSLDNILAQSLYDASDFSFLSLDVGLHYNDNVQLSVGKLLNAVMVGKNDGISFEEKTLSPEKNVDSNFAMKSSIDNLDRCIGIMKSYRSANASWTDDLEKIVAIEEKLKKGELDKATILDNVLKIKKNWHLIQKLNWNKGSEKFVKDSWEDLAQDYANLTKKNFTIEHIKKLPKASRNSKKNWRNPYFKFYDYSATSKMSDMLACARVMDKNSNKKYWSQPQEMLARSFETYIYDKLKEKNRRNDYLVPHSLDEEKIAKWSKSYKREVPENSAPYPVGEERKRINKAFDEFFETLKKTDSFAKAISFLEETTDIKELLFI